MSLTVIEPEFKVHRDFGIPKRTRSFKGESKYPVATLRVNDAILGGERVVRGAAVAARTFAKKHPGHKFSIYKLDQEGNYALVRIK